MLFIGLEADITKHAETCLQEVGEKPRSPLVRSSAFILSLHGPPGEKEAQDITKETVPTSAKAFLARGGSTTKRTCQYRLFFQ